MQERLAIYKAMKNDKQNKEKILVNSSAELYGVCRHRSKFHRYIKSHNPCTDEEHLTGPEKDLNGYENSNVCHVCNKTDIESITVNMAHI